MSTKSPESKELWEFGEFRLDVRARLLLRDGIPVSADPEGPRGPRAPRPERRTSRLAGGAPRHDLARRRRHGCFPHAGGLSRAEGARGDGGVDLRRNGSQGRLSLQPPRGAGLRRTVGRPDGTPRDVDPAPEAPADIPDAGRRWWRKPGPALLGLAAASALVAAAVLPIVLRSPATGSAGTPAGATSPPPLLALEREIAVPPDALARPRGVRRDGRPLGAVGVLPPSRRRGPLGVPRAARPGRRRRRAARRGRLLVVRGGRVVARHPSKPEESDLGPLPAGAPRPVEGRVVASRSGRFLGLRGEEALELFERAEKGGPDGCGRASRSFPARWSTWASASWRWRRAAASPFARGRSRTGRPYSKPRSRSVRSSPSPSTTRAERWPSAGRSTRWRSSGRPAHPVRGSFRGAGGPTASPGSPTRPRSWPRDRTG